MVMDDCRSLECVAGGMPDGVSWKAKLAKEATYEQVQSEIKNTMKSKGARGINRKLTDAKQRVHKAITTAKKIFASVGESKAYDDLKKTVDGVTSRAAQTQVEGNLYELISSGKPASDISSSINIELAGMLGEGVNPGDIQPAILDKAQRLAASA